MKIQLDTTNKTIKLEDNIKLSVLVKTLEELLPKGLWKDFTLETNTVIHQWAAPYIIEKYREVEPYRPYWQPWITYSGTNDNIMLCSSKGNVSDGVYNIEA